jgi:hypothetical protein
MFVGMVSRIGLLLLGSGGNFPHAHLLDDSTKGLFGRRLATNTHLHDAGQGTPEFYCHKAAVQQGGSELSAEVFCAFKLQGELTSL